MKQGMNHSNLRRVRKQPVAVLNLWNFNHEAGDRVYTWVKYPETATMVDLVQSRGWGKRASGELTPKPVTKNGKPRIVVRRAGVWYWTD